MSNNQFRKDREAIKILLRQYENLKAGLPDSYIEEDGFEQIVDYFEGMEKFHQALEVSKAATNQFPYSSLLMLQQANLLLMLHQYQEALHLLDQVEAYNCFDSNIYILKTDAYLALDQQQKAATVLEEALMMFDGDEKIDLLFELADVYDDYENFEKVFDCLAMILELEPNNEEALYKVCFWTDFTGRNEESIKLHQRIINEFPYNELAWFNLGAAYQGIRLHEKAIDAYQYAIAIDEKFDYAYRNLGDAYLRLRKYKDAIEVLQKVLELAQPEYVIYEAIGHCYDKLGNFAQARFHYKKASHLNPEDSQIYYKIASTYMNESAWLTAIKCLQTAAKINLLQPDYNLALGICYMQLKDYDEAITYLGNVVRVRPKNTNGWIQLLNCLYMAGMYEEGVEYSEFALDQTDHKTIFMFYKAMFQFSFGMVKEALICLENAMSINPRLVKKFIEINPAVLQHQSVVDIIARHKMKKHL